VELDRGRGAVVVVAWALVVRAWALVALVAWALVAWARQSSAAG